jgi:putative RNA 2'-phosphotransferase
MPTDQRRLTRISKYLSLHLRHRPADLGLVLDPGGWVPIEALLAAAAEHDFPILRTELDQVVAESDKQRFGLDPTGTRIRANQGHSVEVDLQLAPASPPAVLYHGTGPRALAAIRREGLRKMQRHQVHLSADVETATRVGARHGRPSLFSIDTAAMQRDGFTFYVSTNGVWLVERVPPEYLEELADVPTGSPPDRAR